MRFARKASRRLSLADSILPLYETGKGHKTIAKELGISPRITRTVLIEQGVWNPQRPGKKDPTAKWSRHKARFEGKTLALIVEENSRLRQKTVSLWIKADRKQRPTRRRKKAFPTWMDQYKSDPLFRVKHLLRKRIRNTVQRGDKSASTLELLGCTRERFMQHIESQFKKGMHWGNQGTGKGKWHIDHIIPCSKFDLTQEGEQRRCFHWTNMRPMWSMDNIAKRDKITDGQHSLHLNE